jgi:hypothetical protein
MKLEINGNGDLLVLNADGFTAAAMNEITRDQQDRDLPSTQPDLPLRL